jgi:hypothetical protein
MSQPSEFVIYHRQFLKPAEQIYFDAQGDESARRNGAQFRSADPIHFAAPYDADARQMTAPEFAVAALGQAHCPRHAQIVVGRHRYYWNKDGEYDGWGCFLFRGEVIDFPGWGHDHTYFADIRRL